MSELEIARLRAIVQREASYWTLVCLFYLVAHPDGEWAHHRKREG